MSSTTPDGHIIRQMINDREIGGECHNAVLQANICGTFDLSPIEAAAAIDEAHVQGFIKPGFWDKLNWAPRSDLHPYDRQRARAHPRPIRRPTEGAR